MGSFTPTSQTRATPPNPELQAGLELGSLLEVTRAAVCVQAGKAGVLNVTS